MKTKNVVLSIAVLGLAVAISGCGSSGGGVSLSGGAATSGQQTPAADSTAGTATAAVQAGKTIYDGRCAGCHKLGSYDTTGSYMDLMGTGNNIEAKFSGSHNGITLAATESRDVRAFIDVNSGIAPAPAADPTPDAPTSPAPAAGTPQPATSTNGKNLYDGRCAGCHKLGSYDAAGSPELAGKGSAVTTKLAASHMGITLAATDVADIRTFIEANSASPAPAPVVTTPPVPVPVSPQEPASTPTPAPAAPAGKASFDSKCAGCHSFATLSGRGNLVASKFPVAGAAGHNGITLSATEITDIRSYLDAPAAGQPASPSAPAPVVLDGQTLYANYCALCHGSLTRSDIRGESASDTQSAINRNKGGMGTATLKSLTITQLEAIANALR
ncbi:hypothetical protein [Geobacter sp. DSM 9736]|uniref:hypothetical protein n=1 Tax=Geobacter sp. DSM 9736 TaxID=1277350 RepID=UPI000B511E2B|nr:hypothetical protein [Geobacter sp. DSM 9736]SNB44825.1 hypothetical protein SAMN06269301_0214 [Geobacter sp. DSM 9736]